MSDRVIIENGSICDGSGKEPEAFDLLIENGLIADIAVSGTFSGLNGPRINAAGSVVSPGFIDAHAHGDTRKLRYPEQRSKLLQGVTTEIDGNCGSSAGCFPGSINDLSWKDLTEYARVLDTRPASVNTVVLCGHNTLRKHVMTDACRAAAPEEIKKMQQLLEKNLSAGAAGWTTGLTYFPGKFAETSELLALSEVTANSRKIYATHMRSEGDELIEAVEESVKIAAAGSGRLQISHLKTIFSRNYFKIDQLLETIDKYQRSGMEIYADRYPYIYSSTRIGQTLPPPYDKMPDISQALRQSAEFQNTITLALEKSPRDLASTILLDTGKTLAEMAEEQKCPVEKMCMLLLMEDAEQTAAYLCMSGDNLKRILSLPYVCAGSDGISSQLDDPREMGHPRAVGTFPTFFRMVKNRAGVGEAVRKMTGLPAEIFRIPRRGFIRKGYVADLVIFDPEHFDSPAGFGSGELAPRGIERVMVSGKTAWSAASPDKVGCFGRFIAID